MIYYRGRWLIEPEIKALLTKLEAERERGTETGEHGRSS